MPETTTTAAVEDVARAIFAADGTDADWKWQEGRWEKAVASGEAERYRFLARAAMKATHYEEQPTGRLSAEDRASMFIDWCAIQGFPSKAGWPAGAYEQLIAHIRQSERPFPLKD